MAKGLNIIAGLRLNTSAFTTSLKGASVAVGSMSANASKGMSGLASATNFATIGAIALVKVLGEALSITMDYAKATSELKGILGGTAEDMSELNAQAQALGGSTVHTATEVVKLQTALARLGFAKDEIVAMTESILHLGTAMGVSLDAAANLVGSTLRAFGLEAEEAARVSDVLTKATTESSLTFAKLKISMPYASTAAKQFGLSIETTASMLGILADRGLRASTMGTSLRKIFITLKAKGLDFNTVMADINNSTNKAATAYKYFGLTAANAGIILAESGSQLDTLTGKLVGATGSTKELAETMADNLAGDITLAKSAWEGFILSVDDGTGTFSTAVREMVQGVTTLLEEFKLFNNESTSMSDKIKIVGNTFIKYARFALKPFLIGIEAIISAYEYFSGKEVKIGFDVNVEGKAIKELYDSKKFQKQLLDDKRAIRENFTDVITSAKEINKVRARSVEIETEIGTLRKLIGTDGFDDDATNKEIVALGAELKANKEILSVHQSVVNTKGRQVGKTKLLTDAELQALKAAKNSNKEQWGILYERSRFRISLFKGTLEELLDLERDHALDAKNKGIASTEEGTEARLKVENKYLEDLLAADEKYYQQSLLAAKRAKTDLVDVLGPGKQVSPSPEGLAQATGIVPTGDYAGYTEIIPPGAFEEVKSFNELLKESVNFTSQLTSAFDMLGEAISGAIEGQDQVFAQMAVGVLSSINKIINALLAEMIIGVAATEGSKLGLIGLGAAAIGLPIAIGGLKKMIAGNKENYAMGGIVPGNSFSGDHINAGLNSREMVLNQAQQANLFAMANGAGGSGAGQVEFEIRGDRLVGVLQKYDNKMSKIR